MSDTLSDTFTAQGLVSALSAFSEDDLIRYDHYSRKEICQEITRLCKDQGAAVPVWVKNLDKNNKRYDAQAEVRGVTPVSLIDEINFEVDGDFKTVHAFGHWLSALNEADELLHKARVLAAPEDEEMKSFLEDAEKGNA